MKSLVLSFLVIIFSGSVLFSQSHKIYNDLFSPSTIQSMAGNRNANIHLLDLNKATVKSIFKDEAKVVSIALPFDGQQITLDLIEVNIFSDNFSVVNANDEFIHIEAGRHYQGSIRGSNGSYAALSVCSGEVYGLLSDATGNYNLGKVKGEEVYAFYKDNEVNFDIHQSCKVRDTKLEQDISGEQPLEVRSAKTVNLYVEMDYDIFQTAGSVNNAVSHATAMYNQVFALYAKDGITMKLSKIKSWDAPSPYTYDPNSQDLTGDYLVSFQKNSGAFDGNVAILMTLQQLGGGVATGFNALCASEPDSSKCIAAIHGEFQNIPTFSWDVQVCTHEIGHLLGSRHTHACVWNGNNTAIDGCATYIEGECPLPGYPAEGGTIMSYCHQQSVGINLSLGFGSQPKNYLLNRINNAACLTGSGTLTVDPQFVLIPPSGDCKNINVTATSEWKAEFDPAYPPFFLTSASPLGGSSNATIQLCASNNTLPVPLYTVLYVYDNSTEIPIIVRQDSVYAPTAVFYPGDQTITPFAGETFSLDILTNTDWKLIQKEYDKKWVTIKSATSGTKNAPFTVEVKKNTTPLNRFSRITMVYNNGLDTTYFTISQPSENSGYLNVPTEFSAFGAKNSYQFNVYSDLDWEITEKPAWVTEITPVKGKKNQVVTATLDDNLTGNERFGTITFIAKTITKDSIVKVLNINQLELRSDESQMKDQVYPNPSNGQINVQLVSLNTQALSIRIMDANGRQVKNLENGRNFNGAFTSAYDISDLTGGFYTMEIRKGDEIIREKIILLNK